MDTITFERFVEEFEACGLDDQFSEGGIQALYKHLDIEGEPMEELDVLQIFREYAEHPTVAKLFEAHPDKAPADVIASGDWGVLAYAY